MIVGSVGMLVVDSLVSSDPTPEAFAKYPESANQPVSALIGIADAYQRMADPAKTGRLLRVSVATPGPHAFPPLPGVPRADDGCDFV